MALKITKHTGKKLKLKDFFSEDDIVISDNTPLSYLAFCMEGMRVKYGISMEQLLILLYLKNLKIFRLTIDIMGVTHSVGVFKDLKWIKKYKSYKVKKAYVLTDLGHNIVSDTISFMDNLDEYIGCNRIVSIDSRLKIRELVSTHFSKPTNI